MLDPLPTVDRDWRGNLQHSKRWMPIMYVTYFGILQAIAQKHGYALAVHGSVTRDFDLVMVPFEPAVSPHDAVLADIREAIGHPGKSSQASFDQIGYQPHGRTCYTIESGGGGYFDISFTPTVQQVVALIETDARRAEEIQHILQHEGSDEPVEPQQIETDDVMKQASYHYKEYMRLMATLWENPK